MQRRLRLAGAPPAADWSAPRRVLPRPSIGVADGERGQRALAFALELTQAAHARGIPVDVTLVDFAHAPQLQSGEAARFAELARSVRARHEDGSPVEESGAPGLQLWVGAPALVACEPALSVWVGASPSASPAASALREAAARSRLAICAPRPGLTARLVEALCESGFLPAR